MYQIEHNGESFKLTEEKKLVSIRGPGWPGPGGPGQLCSLFMLFDFTKKNKPVLTSHSPHLIFAETLGNEDLIGNEDLFPVLVRTTEETKIPQMNHTTVMYVHVLE